MHILPIVEKLLYSSRLKTKKALAHNLGYSNRGFYKAVEIDSPALYGKILLYALKENININWLFEVNCTIPQEQNKCQK